MTESTNKSFILHKDSLSVLNKLNDEQAGKLFKAISDYQTQNILPQDNLISIIFEPFFNQFKRDAEKYINTCEARRVAGSKGGKQKVANASKCKQELANLADSDSKNKNKNDSDSKNDNNAEEGKKKKNFKKPTIEEIKNYILEISASISPESFFDYYESKGWKVGNTPMKDWKATVRNWNRKEQRPRQTFVRESESDQRKRFFQEYANKLGDE